MTDRYSDLAAEQVAFEHLADLIVSSGMPFSEFLRQVNMYYTTVQIIFENDNIKSGTFFILSTNFTQKGRNNLTKYPKCQKKTLTLQAVFLLQTYFILSQELKDFASLQGWFFCY